MSILTALWILACGTLQFVVATQVTESKSDMLYSFWLGTVWAGWSASVWLSTAAPRPLYRFFFLVALWFWHALMLSSKSQEPLLRYALMLGAFGVAQSICLMVCKFPSWVLQPLRLSSSKVTRQFSILDLLLLMTGLAAFIAGTKQYQPPAGQAYWIGLPMIFLTLLVLWGLVISSVNARIRIARSMFALSVPMWVVAGAYATGEVENQLRLEPIAQSLAFHMLLYISFAGWTMLLATIGKLEANLLRTAEPPP